MQLKNETEKKIAKKPLTIRSLMTITRVTDAPGAGRTLIVRTIRSGTITKTYASTKKGFLVKLQSFCALSVCW